MYYQTKKKQRDDILHQMIQEIESKYRERKTSTDYFLQRHANLAQMMTKITLKAFTQRTNRENQLSQRTKIVDDTPSSSMKQLVFGKSVISSPKNNEKAANPKMQFSVLRRVSETPKDQTNFTESNEYSIQYGIGSQTAKEKISKIDISGLSPRRDSSHKNLKSPRIDRIVSNPTDFDNLCTIETDEDQDAELTPHMLTKNDDNTVRDEYGLIKMRESFEGQITLQRPPPKESFRNSFGLFKKQGGVKGMRSRSKSDQEKELSTVRNSMNEIMRLTYIENTVPHNEFDINNAEDFKFVFSDDKDTRMRLISKQRHLKQGAFSTSSDFNYLEHKHKLGEHLKKRFKNKKELQIIVRDKDNDASENKSIRTMKKDQASQFGPGYHASSTGSQASMQDNYKTHLNKFLADDNMSETGKEKRKGLLGNTNNSSSRHTLFALTPRSNDLTRSTDRNTIQSTIDETYLRSPSQGMHGRSQSYSAPSNFIHKGANTVRLTSRPQSPVYNNLLQKSAQHRKLHIKRPNSVKSANTNDLKGSLDPKMNYFKLQK